MKLAPREVSNFVAQGRWKKFSLLLFFGHAEEIMHNYTDQILQKAEINRSDAFAFLRLYGADIQQDAHLMLHEATSSSLTMQERWIMVQGKTKELEEAAKQLLQPDMHERLGENTVVLIFSDLPTKSPLLKKAADLDWVAAIPCYEASAETLFNEIRLFSQQQKIRMTPETENLLLECAENNLSQLKHLLEKISLYNVKGTLEQETVLACHGDDQQLSIQDFTLAVFSSRVDDSDRFLLGLLEQKVVPIALIRALSQHCMKLQRLQSLAQTSSLDQAMKLHQPPIFFKQAPILRQQCQRWPNHKIQEVLKNLLEQEVLAKSHRFYDTVLFRQYVLRIAKSA